MAEKMAKCFRCTRCTWVDCYSKDDLRKYGEPSECGDNYHESLQEIDLVEGFAALVDKAAIGVRQAQRALDDAQAVLTYWEDSARATLNPEQTNAS